MKRCPACETVFAQGGEFCSMDGTPLVPLLVSPAAADSVEEDGTHPTLVSGSLPQRESRPTIRVGRPTATGDLDVEALTLALSQGDMALVGHVLADKYELEALIGRGGMGVVYRGRHQLLDRPVAVKLLRPQFLSDDRAVQRFLREAQAMARVEHPNAVTIHDFGLMANGAAYLVMEFIEGETLRTVLGRAKRLPLADAVAIAQQICDAVEAAHRQGIVHRDLKPENIMFKRAEEGAVVKVVDFGLAKLLDGISGAPGEAITSSHDLFGTPAYMAPEHYEGEVIDARADVYAIGVMLYEMISGAPPFQGTVQSIMSGHLFKEPPPLAESIEESHPAVEAVIRRALEKVPSARFETPAELAAALREAASAALGYETVAVPDLRAKPIVTGSLASETGPQSVADTTETIGRPVSYDTPATIPSIVPPDRPRRSRRPLAATAAVVTTVALGGLIFATSRAEPPAAPPPEPLPAVAAVPPAAPQPAAPQPAAPQPAVAQPAAPPPADPPPVEKRVAAPAEPTASPAAKTTRKREEATRDEGSKKAEAPRETAKRPEARAATQAKDEKKKKKRRWFNPFSW
jgi:serine/threonine-protein kinase